MNGLFTTGRDAPVTYKSVRQIFAKAAGTAGLVDVRLHDLRRTVMTRAAMAGVGTHVLRDLLGHRTTAMADRYIRFVGKPGARRARTGRRSDGRHDAGRARQRSRADAARATLCT